MGLFDKKDEPQPTTPAKRMPPLGEPTGLHQPATPPPATVTGRIPQTPREPEPSPRGGVVAYHITDQVRRVYEQADSLHVRLIGPVGASPGQPVGMSAKLAHIEDILNGILNVL